MTAGLLAQRTFLVDPVAMWLKCKRTPPFRLVMEWRLLVRVDGC